MRLVPAVAPRGQEVAREYTTSGCLAITRKANGDLNIRRNKYSAKVSGCNQAFVTSYRRNEKVSENGIVRESTMPTVHPGHILLSIDDESLENATTEGIVGTCKWRQPGNNNMTKRRNSKRI